MQWLLEANKFWDFFQTSTLEQCLKWRCTPLLYNLLNFMYTKFILSHIEGRILAISIFLILSCTLADQSEHSLTLTFTNLQNLVICDLLLPQGPHKDLIVLHFLWIVMIMSLNSLRDHSSNCSPLSFHKYLSTTFMLGFVLALIYKWRSTSFSLSSEKWFQSNFVHLCLLYCLSAIALSWSLGYLVRKFWVLGVKLLQLPA